MSTPCCQTGFTPKDANFTAAQIQYNSTSNLKSVCAVIGNLTADRIVTNTLDVLNPNPNDFFINVEGSNLASGIINFGPFPVNNGSTLRILSTRLGLNIVPGSASVTLEPISEMGWIGLGVGSFQPAPSGVTQVLTPFSFDDTSLPSNPSFQLNTPGIGDISILLDGIYRFNYNLEVTCQGLTPGGLPIEFQSYLEYFDGANQQVGFDRTHGPEMGASTPRNITLNDSFIVKLTAGQIMRLYVNHNSAIPELIVGPITGPFFGAPTTHHSYLQVQRIG
jgi:hypothetical protein